MTSHPVGVSPRCYALVPCAGSGSRAGLGSPKQYRAVAGRPLVAHALDALARVVQIEATLVVLSEGDARFEAELPGLAGERLWLAHCGGATRAASVAAGLEALRQRGVRDEDWVLVHDAARCLIRPAWVERLIDACLGDAVGGLLALPLADTLKTGQDGRVAATVAREDKWAAQTPQMFRLGLLARALAVAAQDSAQLITDEASAVEALGLRPLLVRGDYENFKVTWPGDFELAGRLLRSAL